MCLIWCEILNRDVRSGRLIKLRGVLIIDDMPELQPFQEWDFVKDDQGKEVAYLGPISKLRYPKWVDIDQEMVCWIGLGYRIQVGFSYGEDDRDTLLVMGDIPEWAQREFRELGVEVSLHKPRGERTVLHPTMDD
jgi:hypothetical protein